MFLLLYFICTLSCLEDSLCTSGTAYLTILYIVCTEERKLGSSHAIITQPLSPLLYLYPSFQLLNPDVWYFCWIFCFTLSDSISGLLLSPHGWATSSPTIGFSFNLIYSCQRNILFLSQLISINNPVLSKAAINLIRSAAKSNAIHLRLNAHPSYWPLL